MLKSIKNFRKKPLNEKLTYILFFVFFSLAAAVFLFCLLWCFVNSFKTTADFFKSPFALPEQWVGKNWQSVFTKFNYRGFYYFDMLFNSLWILVVKVAVNVLSSAFLAYAVARFEFPGKRLIFAVAVFVQTIPVIGSGTAAYKLLLSLNMVNNPYLIWISWATGFDFAFLILYGTFKGISMSYSESAKIDGAGNLTVLFRIVFPQAFPAVVAICVTQAIGVWNDFGTVQIYLREFPNLAYGLYVFAQESNYLENSKAVYLAAICISMVPIMLLFACFQKLIMTNMTAGGLKG